MSDKINLPRPPGAPTPRSRNDAEVTAPSARRVPDETTASGKRLKEETTVSTAKRLAEATSRETTSGGRTFTSSSTRLPQTVVEQRQLDDFTATLPPQGVEVSHTQELDSILLQRYAKAFAEGMVGIYHAAAEAERERDQELGKNFARGMEQLAQQASGAQKKEDPSDRGAPVQGVKRER